MKIKISSFANKGQALIESLIYLMFLFSFFLLIIKFMETQSKIMTQNSIHTNFGEKNEKYH